MYRSTLPKPEDLSPRQPSIQPPHAPQTKQKNTVEAYNYHFATSFIFHSMSSNQFTNEELLRRLQEVEQRLQEVEQKRREEEQKRREEEQKLHLIEQELEKTKEKSRPTSFKEALRLWHTLYSNPKIRYRAGKVNASHFTSPAKRLYPESLRPWDDFSHLHRQAWNEIVQAVNSTENKFFDPKSTYESEANRFMPKLVLHDESHLVGYLERTLEEHVINIGERISLNMTFKYRDVNSLDDVTNRIEQMDFEDRASTPLPRRRYDKVCSIMETEGERPVLVVEYKAAHKLSPALINRFRIRTFVQVGRYN